MEKKTGGGACTFHFGLFALFICLNYPLLNLKMTQICQAAAKLPYGCGHRGVGELERLTVRLPTQSPGGDGGDRGVLPKARGVGEPAEPGPGQGECG